MITNNLSEIQIVDLYFYIRNALFSYITVKVMITTAYGTTS